LQAGVQVIHEIFVVYVLGLALEKLTHRVPQMKQDGNKSSVEMLTVTFDEAKSH